MGGGVAAPGAAKGLSAAADVGAEDPVAAGDASGFGDARPLRGRFAGVTISPSASQHGLAKHASIIQH